MGLCEIDPKDILPKTEEPSKLDVLKARLQNVREDIGNLKADLKAAYSRGLTDVLRDKEKEEESLASELQEEMSRTVKTAEKTWRGLPSLVSLVEKHGDDARLKLRVSLRRIVTEIWVLLIRQGCRHLAVVQVRFDGGHQREFLIDYSAAGNMRPGWWRTCSLRSAFGVYDPASPSWTGLCPFDLGDPAGVERTSNILTASADEVERLFNDCPKYPIG
jgi:hypothetical protein